MKFLKRKSGDTRNEDGFDDYVEPFPPRRPTRQGPAEAAPGQEDNGGFDWDADAFHARLNRAEAPQDADDDDDDDDDDEWDYGGDTFGFAAAEPQAEDAPIFPGSPDEAPRRRRPTAAEAEERRMAMLGGLTPDPAAAPAAAAAPPPPEDDDIAVPPPAAGRAGAQGGRAKTRLLGFAGSADDVADPFARAAEAGAATAGPAPHFPVGWLVVIDGPGRGAHFTLFNGVSQIGRGADQAIRLDFGDTSISRSGHALLAYDDEQAKFFLGSGGKVNIVRLNDSPLLSTEELSNDDVIRIGETTLRFVAFCGAGFSWSEAGSEDAAS